MTSVRTLLDATLARLAQVGADPGDDDETRLRKALLVLIAVLILPIALTWWFLYTSMGTWTGNIALVYAAISIGSIVLFARMRDFRLLFRIQLAAILLAPTLSMLPLGGFLPAGGVGIWGIMAPLGALVFNGVRSGVRWFIAFVVVFLGSGLIGIALDIPSPLPVWFSSLMLALNVSVGGTMVFTLLALFAKQREAALTALRAEQERSESLLLNILPGSIADRLKAHPGTIADQFTAASVLFADVVDFTPRSEHLAPAEVVGILDRLFSHFDALAERYGLEKIKTIGDCYMVAAGVPESRPDHARALALLALDMVRDTRPGGPVGDLGLELRVGINSGPVVAGVIGRKRFLYDLWGDAVNTASRMESRGTPDRIQITGTTHELIKDEFECEPRGTVSVKGKGEMDTWYLVEQRASAKGKAVVAGAAGPTGAIDRGRRLDRGRPASPGGRTGVLPRGRWASSGVGRRSLNPAAARAFFADTIPGYIAHFPRIGRALFRLLFRFVDRRSWVTQREWMQRGRCASFGRRRKRSSSSPIASDRDLGDQRRSPVVRGVWVARRLAGRARRP